MDKFIRLVKARSFLYDNNNIDFKNREKRVEAWDEIAQIMGRETGNHWRFKWSYLKENYNKFRKINENPSNQIYKKYRNWPWAEHLKFLDNFPTRRMLEQNRLNTSQTKQEYPDKIDAKFLVTDELSDPQYTEPNFENLTCRVKPGATDELSKYVEISNSDDDLVSHQLFLIEKTFTVDEQLDNPEEEIQDSHEDSPKPKKRKLNSDFREKLSEYIEMKNGKKNDFDEVEHFFMSYAKTFKRLPVNVQRVLKLEMITLFARYELQAEIVDNVATQRRTKVI